jgi:phospholipid/cholesterol/gamma-HCH transport system ATP-binding protein
LLLVKNIQRAFGTHRVLCGVSFELQSGELCGLIGPSGGGKSVLLKIIAGVTGADYGEVSHAPQAKISLMFQEGALFDSLSVFDNVAFPLVQGKVPAANLSAAVRERVREQVSDILAHVGLSKASAKMPGQLSGGMRRRVALARALVNRPELLLLDDPTSGLDPVASSIIMKLIKDLHEEYRPTCLMVSQDLRRLLPIVHRILGLFEGKIVFNGDLAALAGQSDAALRHFVACRYELPEPKLTQDAKAL